jgi:hypothetical protein
LKIWIRLANAQSDVQHRRFDVARQALDGMDSALLNALQIAYRDILLSTIEIDQGQFKAAKARLLNTKATVATIDAGTDISVRWCSPKELQAWTSLLLGICCTVEHIGLAKKHLSEAVGSIVGRTVASHPLADTQILFRA